MVAWATRPRVQRFASAGRDWRAQPGDACECADRNAIAASLVKSGGLLVACSCSGLVSLEDFEGGVIKGVHRLGRTGPDVDHPVYSNCLESRYLKVRWV